jgi:hypothetical protein
MDRFKEVVRKRFPPLAPILFFFPERHIAANIKDFLDDRKNVRPTRYMPLHFFGKTFRGKARIDLDSYVIYSPVDEDVGNISDSTGSVNLSFHESLQYKRKFLVPGNRLYHVQLIYTPESDHVALYDLYPRPYEPGSKRRFPLSLEKMV